MPKRGTYPPIQLNTRHQLLCAPHKDVLIHELLREIPTVVRRVDVLHESEGERAIRPAVAERFRID